MKFLRLAAAVVCFLAACAAAYGQNAGTVTNHAYAIGKGPGVAGYTSLLCAAAQFAVGQTAADPICRTMTGDATLSAAGALALATVNANVGTFGGVNSIPSFTVDGKGRITAAAANVPAIPFTELTGSLACAQTPAYTGDVTKSAGVCATVLAAVNANVGTFGSSTQCVTATVNAKGLVTAISQTACAGTPGGSNTQVQYNNAGVLGGFTLGGDATLNTSTGALTLATVNSNTGPFGSATSCVTVTNNAKGLTTAVSAATCTPALGSITGFGTGVAAALAVNVGTAGSPVINGGVGGTPSSMTGTNIIGIPNAGLLNSSTTVAGATCTLGSTCGLTSATNTLGAPVNLTGSYLDGPSATNGTTGTWFASGTVTLTGTTGDLIVCKLYDGTNVIAAANQGIQNGGSLALSGIITTPTGNIRIACANTTAARGTMASSNGLTTNASTVSAFRIN